MEHVPVTFLPRDVPLTPLAVVGVGSVARALAERVLAMDDAELTPLRGVASRSFFLLLGAEAALPWVDGVTYLGRDERAPLLLLPTHLAPSAPVAAFEGAILAHVRAHAAARPPFAVLPMPPALLSTECARPLARHVVEAWLAGAEASP